MNNPNPQIQQKIKIIEQAIQDTKASLKNWANQIGQHHKTLKQLTSQLATLKNQLNPNMNKPNKTNQGGIK